jgi:hypothetical protein
MSWLRRYLPVSSLRRPTVSAAGTRRSATVTVSFFSALVRERPKTPRISVTAATAAKAAASLKVIVNLMALGYSETRRPN